jgi:predicted nucleic acid binding AN1-type Zn finger protein
MENTKPRCNIEGCRRRLTLTDVKCRCGERFCGNHRYPEEHMCSYDYKKAGYSQLSTMLVQVVGKKVEAI